MRTSISFPSGTPIPSGSPAPAAGPSTLLDLGALEGHVPASTFIVGDVKRNTPAGSAPGTRAPVVQAPRTLAELRAQLPSVYGELVVEARAAVEQERARQTEAERVPGLLGLKKQLKGSPLFEGISEIVEDAIVRGQSFNDTLVAVVRWTASGSAVASLEGVPDIRIGQTEGASGETPRADNRKMTVEA